MRCALARRGRLLKSPTDTNAVAYGRTDPGPERDDRPFGGAHDVAQALTLDRAMAC